MLKLSAGSQNPPQEESWSQSRRQRPRLRSWQQVQAAAGGEADDCWEQTLPPDGCTPSAHGEGNGEVWRPREARGD